MKYWIGGSYDHLFPEHQKQIRTRTQELMRHYKAAKDAEEPLYAFKGLPIYCESRRIFHAIVVEQ
jgi:hypothetical protein